MKSFISEGTDLREELTQTEPLACSAELWEARRGAFAPEKRAAVTVVTVGSQVPLEPYGTKLGFFQKLFRRVVRKSIRWYSEDLLRRQNEVNRALLERIETLEARIKELEET